MFCVDEKTAIQALARLDPVLPLPPGRAERHGFEYYRHGTLSLYAALNVKTGRVEGKKANRHASADFIAFLTELIGKTKWAREIHIVLDNLSAHKTRAVGEFPAQNPKVRFHFTPTYSSWLNQVEIWFAKFAPTPNMLSPSAGPTPIRNVELPPSESPGRPTSPGRRSAGMASAPGRPLART